MQSLWTHQCVKTVLVLLAVSLLSVCEGLLSAKSLCFEVVPLSIIDCWIFEAPVEALAYEFPSTVKVLYRHVSHVHPRTEHLSSCPSSSLNIGPKCPHNLPPSPWQQWTCSCSYLLMQMMSCSSPSCQSQSWAYCKNSARKVRTVNLSSELRNLHWASVCPKCCQVLSVDITASKSCWNCRKSCITS